MDALAGRRRTRLRSARLALVALSVLVSVLSLTSAAPASPTTGLLDDFNRADESPVSQGGNWAPTGFAGIAPATLAGEVLVRNAASNDSASYRQADYTGDMEAHFTISETPSSSNVQYLFIALQDVGVAAFDGYAALLERQASGFRLHLRRYSNGAPTTLASTGFFEGVAAGNKMLLRRVGTTIEAWLHQSGVWTLKLSAANQTQYAGAGKIGVRFFRVVGTPGSMDDFGGGSIGAPPPGGAPPPEQTFGTGEDGCGINGCGGSSLFADPVNSRTGAFTTSVDDLDLPGTGVSFAWSRSYTSADPTVGRLGPGWTDSYSASLAVQPSGDVLLHGEDGQQLLYTEQPNGSFVGAPGSLSTLSSVAGGYELLRTDQVLYRFDTQGRLLSMKDRNDQGVTLAYDGQNRLASVTDAANRQATISYTAQDLVSRVQTPDGRSVGYGYTAGRLTTLTDVRGKTWTYTYDSGGRLATIVDPLSHTQVTNVYAGDSRVQSQTDALGKTTTFAWNEETETAIATDANQKLWTHDYDEGVLVEEVDPLGNGTDLVRDDDLNTTSVTGPTNETTAMTYDDAGNMLSATAPPSLGSVEKTFVYNARNDVELVTDARGKVTDYAYNPTTGNLTSVTQDGIGVGSYTYDAAGRVETFTDGNEKTWTYAYFPATGYLASSSDPLGNTTTYTYDGAGRVLTRVDPKGNVAGCNCASDFTWTYTYTPAGQQLTETNPLGHTTTNVYDDAGRLTSTSDPLGRITSYTYDDANRVLTQIAPDPDGGGPLTAPVTTSTYDNVGNKLTETDPRGNTSTFAYDDANRLVATTGPDPDGTGPLSAPVTTNTYDPNGNLASTVEPRGNVSGASPDEYRTTFTYDAAGRMLTETRPDPDGGGPQSAPATTNAYDPVGNLQSVRDGNNHTTSYTYDAAGRIRTVTGPDLGVTTYTYDDAGNVLTRRDDNNHLTTSAYDDAGRLVTETSPDPDGPGPQGPAVTSYTYDPNGNRLTLTDPNGNATPAGGDGVTTYGYDGADRQTSITHADATADVSFSYDAAGNRLSMVDGSGTETRTYDALDRVLTVARGSNTFSYVYDAASNVTRRTYPGNTIVNYTYDPLNRLTTVQNGSQTTSYAYDPASNVTQTTLPSGNGYVETRVYDRSGRLTAVKNQKGATVLSHFVSTLDPVGNPTQVARTGGLAQTQTYTYDASDRLTGVCFQATTCPGGTDPFIRWTYDRVGNRLTEERPSVASTAYTYDARDRLLSAGSTSFAYDVNGNQLQKGTRSFTYDLANRVKTTTSGSTTTTYSYDGEGKRLQASTGSSNSSKTNFLWDTSFGLPQVARENNGSGSLQRRYVYGERRISLTNSSNTTYYHYDALGSTANVTSSGGSTRWTYSYEPFGSIRTQTSRGSAPTNFMKFTGEYLDPTALYHLRARQYDAASGRFLRRDPAGQSPNHSAISAFIYTADRPTVMVDPSGETFGPSRAFRRAINRVSKPELLEFVCLGLTCGGKAQVRTVCGARPGHPLARVGGWLGGPGEGTHARGDWEDRNAVDISVPVGTTVCAVFDGVIDRSQGFGPLRNDGRRFTLAGRSQRAYYAHLSKIFDWIRPGVQVRKDQALGHSGRSSSGSPHLHIALERGNPTRFCKRGRLLDPCF